MLAYLLILSYILVLFLIGFLCRSTGPNTVEKHVFAGGNIPTWLLTTSVFSSWMWVTTIIGSAEAFLIYGISGAIAYVVGACIAFGFFVPLVILVLRSGSHTSNYLSFMGERYNVKVKNMYYAFAMLVSAYVLIEQAAGVGLVLNQLFGGSYKHLSFAIVLVGALYVTAAGMKGILFSEFTAAILTIGGFLLFFALLYGRLDVHEIQAAALQVNTNAFRPDYNPNLFKVIYLSGFRYFVMAIIIAFSQLIFDPAYYIKARMAKDDKAIRRSFLLGGILLWAPISITSALFLGFLSLPNHSELTFAFTPALSLLFGVLILYIGGSAINHYLVGIMSLFTIDFYKSYIKSDATDKEQILFGRIVTLLFGVFCALITISLENISLLTIDMFCSVFFAAPCGGLIAGIFTKEKTGNLPVWATAAGMSCGFILWTSQIINGEVALFLGTLTSFFLPLILCFLPHRSGAGKS